MDAKSIWIPATQRIINSSTYKVKKKPNTLNYKLNLEILKKIIYNHITFLKVRMELLDYKVLVSMN